MRILLIVGMCALSTSCSWIAGSGLYQDIRTRVPEGTVVRDVYSGDTLAIDSVARGGQNVGVLSLRNGKRHALQFKRDSGVQYRTFNLKRNWWGALNVYSPTGVGFLVDQVAGTAYHLTPNMVHIQSFETMSAASQKIVEDSLRKINRYPIPHSVIDHRTTFVASVWGTLGIAGPSNAQLPFGPLHVGVGLAPIPEIMLFWEYGWVGSLVYPDLHDVPYGSYGTRAEFRSLGICLQEPVYGLFASWRYGTGFTTAYATETGALPDRNATITHYSLGIGFYGQWGRIEYRVPVRANKNWTVAFTKLVSHLTQQAVY